MISSSAITQYLARPAENHAWMKSLSAAELDACIAEIQPTPRIKVPFNQAQKVCFILGTLHEQFVYNLDMGLGKTALSLELLRWFFDAGILQRVLIVAPTDEIVLGWEDEIKRWEIDLPYHLLLGSGIEKWQTILVYGTGDNGQSEEDQDQTSW